MVSRGPYCLNTSLNILSSQQLSLSKSFSSEYLRPARNLSASPWIVSSFLAFWLYNNSIEFVLDNTFWTHRHWLLPRLRSFYKINLSSTFEVGSSFWSFWKKKIAHPPLVQSRDVSCSNAKIAKSVFDFPCDAVFSSNFFDKSSKLKEARSIFDSSIFQHLRLSRSFSS